ncbi:Ribonucleases P/MRP protein subunit POP7 [Spathaspora sp. JA1]|nr:Ribonucleases P/MRP protein subunit POP7 [Spathaspora sp. JA1]
MAKRTQGKHIKHTPNIKPRTQTEQISSFLIKSNTPYVSAIKKITKQLENFEKLTGIKKYQSQFKQVKYITVKGMGKCLEKTLSVGLYFQERYKVDILTGTVEVLDEFQQEDEEDDSIYKKRLVSSVELRIWLKRD